MKANWWKRNEPNGKALRGMVYICTRCGQREMGESEEYMVKTFPRCPKCKSEMELRWGKYNG